MLAAELVIEFLVGAHVCYGSLEVTVTCHNTEGVVSPGDATHNRRLCYRKSSLSEIKLKRINFISGVHKVCVFKSMTRGWQRGERVSERNSEWLRRWLRVTEIMNDWEWGKEWVDEKLNKGVTLVNEIGNEKCRSHHGIYIFRMKLWLLKIKISFFKLLRSSLQFYEANNSSMQNLHIYFFDYFLRRDALSSVNFVSFLNVRLRVYGVKHHFIIFRISI
jgi:hypothetical protein